MRMRDLVMIVSGIACLAWAYSDDITNLLNAVLR
jgi:hypothetical protein